MTEVYKVISAAAVDFADEMNKVANDYAPVTWSIGIVAEGVVITCVLVDAKLIRQAQFMAGLNNAPGNGGFPPRR